MSTEAEQDSARGKIKERAKKKGKGYLLLDHSKYSILPAEPFGRLAYEQGQEALEIYQQSGMIESVTSLEGISAAVIGSASIAAVDSYRRSLNLSENYQKGALERVVREELDEDLNDEEIDELYNRLLE